MAKRIVIGSVLKPLDDVRHYYKLGKTLASLPTVQLFILAKNTSYPLVDEGTIIFKAITNSSFLFLNRYFAPLRFLIQLFNIRPVLVIVSTHELLRIAVLGKFFLRYRLVYDVQENYQLNIKTNKTYKGFLRKMLLFDVWLSETVAKPFVDQYWLAEACYLQELTLSSKKSFTLENKALAYQKVANVTFKDRKEIVLLFSGTVAEENGIWESIFLIDKLHELDARFHLHIVGCCHQPSLFQRLISETKSKKHILFEVSSQPIPYPILLKAIQKADIGLIAYHNQVNFKYKMPTKLFEYLALGKPILLPSNPQWLEYLAPYQCSISLDFAQPEVETIHSQLIETIFYPNGNNATEGLWASENGKLIHLATQLLG